MKKTGIVLLCVLTVSLCNGCGNSKEEVVFPSSDEQQQSEESTYFTESETETSEVSETESIQDEIAKIEEKSNEFENADWGSMNQQEMNQTTGEWYQLWDNELNSLWDRLSNELDADTKAKVLEEQREWIKRKEENVRGAGMEAYGGSLQPQLENSAAEEITRARVYVLAGYLADVRNESFVIDPEIQKSIEEADPSLDEVFQKFEGQWIFDESRGACIGVERSEDCDYGVEGSNWTVWITGGDIISDLDVYGYTGNSIIFEVDQADYEAYYELSFNMAGSVNMAYGTSLDAMDDVIEAQ